MTIQARYVHTNLVAKDWQKLAQFYKDVFGCIPVPPERDLAGPWVDALTAIPGVGIRGVHLRLPGHGTTGPTLEIFQYDPGHQGEDKTVNRPGFAHIAFEVDDVAAAGDAVLAGGGGSVGDLVSLEIPGAGTVTLIYARDPEGNILELQQWDR